MKDDQNRRWPKWKKIKIKYDQNQENIYSQNNMNGKRQNCCYLLEFMSTRMWL